MSKQSYYKRKVKLSLEEARGKIKKLVLNVRSSLPKTGGRKLYHMLQNDLKCTGFKMGRDKLFSFLREEHLLVAKRKKYHKTTNSKHWMKKYSNLIKELNLNRPEQLWVADITYLQAKGRHYYLHLITDAYSKKIVGFNLSDNLQTQSTLHALKIALDKRTYKQVLIHHSDRGLQYCSKEYTDLLKNSGVLISMTESYDPYENAVAERVNGILKEEFNLDVNFESVELMEKNVIQSIALYNQLRPHQSVNMLTPDKAHMQSKIKLKTWKKKNPSDLIQEGFCKFV